MNGPKKRTAEEERAIKERLKDEHLLETFPDEPQAERTAEVPQTHKKAEVHNGT